MKKRILIFGLLCVFAVIFPLSSFANMAAPRENDVAGTVTFEKNEEISVLSEQLEIRVEKEKAQITAVYRIKNRTNEKTETKSMFLAPQIEGERVLVEAKGEKLPYVQNNYSLGYQGTVEKQGWEYVVLEGDNTNAPFARKVAAVSFVLSFEKQEEYTVKVSYDYLLGGYPLYDFDAKNGSIEYFLTPANLWKDFSDLQIDLYLDEELPVLKKSNLDFEKVEKRHYRYVSDSLPEEDLKILLDETAFQSFLSSFRSPYLVMNILYFLPLILLIVIILTGFGILLYKHRKKKKKLLQK